VVFERKVSTTPKALREVFGAMPHSRVALETGTHSPWISRLMKAFALKFRLLSIPFPSEEFETGRKMSTMGIFRQSCSQIALRRLSCSDETVLLRRFARLCFDAFRQSESARGLATQRPK